MKITKSKLNQIIKEESRKLLKEGYGDYSAMVAKLKKNLKENDIDLWSDDEEEHPAYAKDDELREVGADIANLLNLTEELHQKLEGMGRRYGELAHTGTYAKMAHDAAKKLSEKFNNGLDGISRFGGDS